jgi:ubiquinol-cytochrome c reductase cytochrome b subunit
VWLYGPFEPYTASSPAQPDYYAGWLEGLLRLWPNWEFHLFGHTIGELFLPAVVVPGIIFTALALWPFLEARLTRDTAWHHFAQRPREAPVRTAIGAGGLMFMTVLMLAGSNDVLAKFLDVEVDSLNTVLRILVLALPIVVGAATLVICRDLRDAGDHEIAASGRATVRRTPLGGYEVDHDEARGTPRTTGEQESEVKGDATGRRP